MKIAVSVLGLDCPGVVHLVSGTLSGLGCNIVGISQTILLGQFAAIVIADAPDSLAPDGQLEDKVHSTLVKAIAARDMSLSVIVRALDDVAVYDGGPSEPFVISVDGADRPDIISSFTHLLAEHRINIESMKALMSDSSDPASLSSSIPTATPCRALVVFEVALPVSVNRSAFRRTLTDKAQGMGLRISMQHRDIFEALHRVEPI